MSKPQLTVRQIVPIERLSPSEFEGFVCGVTPIIKQAEIVGSPTGSGDDGFDVTLRKLSDGKLICIQCKRYNSRVLNLSHIGPELAKVGLKSLIEGSDIVEHYFLTTGSIRNTINSALRESDYNTLKQRAKKAIQNNTIPKIIRQEAEQKGLDLEQTVENYISSLEKIQVWSREGFDVELTAKWNQLTDILGKYFEIQTVLREYPRPDFNEEEYLEKCSSESTGQYIPLLFRSGQLPHNLSTTTSENPWESVQNFPTPSETKISDLLNSNLVNILSSTPIGTCTLLIGNGGSGKTTTLKMILSEVALQRIYDPTKPLPIFIDLSRYSNTFSTLIHEMSRVRFIPHPRFRFIPHFFWVNL